MDYGDRSAAMADFHLGVEIQQQVAVNKGVSFRFCEGCGQEIPEARRKAQPGCTLCVQCKAEREYR